MSREKKKKIFLISIPPKQLIITASGKLPELEALHREKQTCRPLKRRENCLLCGLQNKAHHSFTTHSHYLAIFTIFSHMKESKWLVFHIWNLSEQTAKGTFPKC